MIKAWWEGLAAREQRMLSIGGAVAGVLLLYAVIWLPLNNAVSSQRDLVHNQEALLSYLTRASQTISRLRATGVRITRPDNESLATHAETVFSSQGVSNAIKQVQQPAANETSFTFESVHFDKLMRSLQVLAQSDINVKKFSATRTTESGLADVRVTLVE